MAYTKKTFEEAVFQSLKNEFGLSKALELYPEVLKVVSK